MANEQPLKFLLYLADVANEDVVQDMACRIESIKVDAILTTGELEGFVEDNSYTLFHNCLSLNVLTQRHIIF